MIENQNYFESLDELYNKYSVYDVSQVNNPRDNYDMIQTSWGSLCESIETYIRWKEYDSPEWTHQENHVGSSVPPGLAVEIDKNLCDSMVVKASSLLESSIKETNIIRIQETFPWIDDFYKYDEYKSDSKKSDYHKLHASYHNSLKIHLPHGKNFDYCSITKALKEVNVSRENNYKDNFEGFGMDKIVLKHLIKSRNKISHGMPSGVNDLRDYYYMMWYAFENCRLICRAMSLKLSNDIEPVLKIDTEDHDDFINSIYTSMIYA